jgi:hypothetical protein
MGTLGLASDGGSELFASLQRSGQRRKAEQYVRGLLGASGRKTLRNIAAYAGGASAQQRMHHFISESPWDWVPVRHALARQARRLLGHDAWVMRPIAIPKAGAHSIGVDVQYMPHLGRNVNGQLAVGTWLVCERSAVPVDWQLVLPPRWWADELRRRANIPDGVRAGSLEECVHEAVAQADETAVAPRRPVIVDVDGTDAVAIARHLEAGGHDFVIRTEPGTPLVIDRSVLPAYGALARTAQELIDTLPSLRTPVGLEHGQGTAAAIPVVAPGVTAGSSPRGGFKRRGLHLVGEWSTAGRSDISLWLTNVTGRSVPALLRLTRLSGVVVRDVETVADRVGIRDFAGRSFSGWHRHITLASVAHFATLLAAQAEHPATPARSAA